MIKYLKEYRFYIILFLFVLIPVVGIDTTTRAPRDFHLWDRVIVSITSPIQATISWSLEQLAAGYNNYVYLWHTRQNNLTLVDENRRLQNQIAGLKETEQENLRLRKLLQFQEKFKIESVVGRVIAKDVSSEFRTIRINRGELSGIRKDMAVITDDGIVGRVLRTTGNTADVVTMLDLLSAVDSIDERSRARGVVEGLTDDTCEMRYTVRTDDIQPGDVLVTSGLGGIFPKGIPVGVVSRVDRKQFGITQKVEVRPSVDFRNLEEVTVVLQVDSEPVLPTEKVSEKSHGKVSSNGKTPEPGENP